MHIADIFQRDRTTFSFEFFPPKTDTGWDALHQRLRDFERLAPSFVSVTYGAGGSTRDRTHGLVEDLHRNTKLDPIPHLTCVAHGEGDINAILERYAKAGVSNILALRGDMPQDADYDASHDAFRYAADLVRFIRQFNERGVHADSRGFGVGVAGFPEGHPETPNRLRQMDHLKAKVDAGVDYICTQMFFDNNAFHDWREVCEVHGVTQPIIAGVMPITSIAGMKRMAELAAGTNFPARLQRKIYQVQDDPEAVRSVGVHWATEQCWDLLENNVSGIHFYTLNQSEATLRIFETLGAKDATSLRS